MDTSHPHPILQPLPSQQNLASPQSLTDLHPADEAYPIIVVRALYPYQANDTATISLSFNKDDLIQVVAQLESGWWYGFCNDTQGWFPSNFVEEITQADLEDSDSQEDETASLFYLSFIDMDILHTSNDDLWLTQQTPDGQVYYFNTRTGDSSWSIPTSSSLKSASLSASSVASLSTASASTSALASTSASASASSNTVAAAPSISASTSASSNPPTSSLLNHHNLGDSTDNNESPSTSIAAQTIVRNASPESSRSSLTGGPAERLELNQSDQSLDNSRSLGSFAQEPNETDGRDESTRPNSWQASAIPTRAGSPISHEGTATNLSSQLAGIRKPSGSAAPGVSLELSEGLPPLPAMSNPFESGPTWDSLAEHISGTVQNLMQSAAHGYKAYYQIQAAQVVESVRVMLYASGTIDKDATPIRLNLDLKIYHRQVMAALSRLVLSAKMASSTWPADGTIAKMRSNADDVANSVHQFIALAQAVGVIVNDVDAKLILDPEGTFESRTANKLSRSISVSSRPSIDGSDKSSNRRSLSSVGVLTQLDYYCKSARKAIKLLALQITKVLESPFVAPPRSSQPSSRLPSGTIMSSAQSSQLVTQCQQTISQIGSLLALVSEYYTKVLAEHPAIKDHIFLDIRVSKQALYNNVAALVMAIQLATDPMAQVTVLEMTLEAIHTAERSVQDLTDATRSLAAENDEAEKQTRTRVTSDGSLTLLDQASFVSSNRQSEIDSYFHDQESDLDGETAKSSQRRSDSRLSSFSSNSSVSGMSAPTTPGTEYTGRSYSTTYPFPQLTPISPTEVTPPSAYRPSITLTQKADARGAKLKKMLGEDAPTPKPVKVAEAPWYLGHDYSPSDISFNMEGHVRGGTIPALIERLTLHDSLDPNFVATFLLTYRSFTTTTQFFTLLFRRITISPPSGLNPTELAQWSDRKLTPIRLRVFNIIKSWLENYYLEDEQEDRQMLPKIKAFAESTQMRELMSFAVVQLIKLVEKREASDGSFRKMVLNLSTQAPQPITPRNLKRIKFMDLDPLEFARQLTVMEATQYNKIKPIECLAKAWTSEDPELSAKACNIKKMIETSNFYANWLNEIILSEPEAKKRVVIIKHLIAVAEAATSPAKNWGDYRQELHSANPPCVPFIGVYLTDLVMIQDGNPDILKGTDQHINFYKRGSTAEVIREIQQYQSVPYCLTTVVEIQTFIRKGLDRSKSVTELYDMSLALEPREGEEEKITRLLSESGFL
ncbi:hypothetical protein BGX26_005980 [Mortierella sp. AD094]|nr:hypothetical protein BGX26_005980 [Mortierella sp. AD094]